MKFAYFYASSPEILHPEMPTLPPLSAISLVSADEFPARIVVGLNTVVLDIIPGKEFSLDVDISTNGQKVESEKKVYETFRETLTKYLDTGLMARYSFLDSFTADSAGIYTFTAKLYEGKSPLNEEGELSYSHQLECSIVVVKGGGNNGYSS